MEGIDNNTDLFAAAKKADKTREAIMQANNLAEAMQKAEIEAIIRRKSRTKEKILKQKRENIKKFTIGFVSGTLTVSLLLAGANATREFISKIEKNLAVKEATVRLGNEFVNRAVENGLGVINEDGKLDTYSAINLDGADYTIVYTARNVLTPEDYNASIQTISTLDGSGKYIDYQQRLRDIGAIDPETGTASTAVEKQMVNDKLYTIYENESYGEILNTCADLENKNQGRGY